MLSKQPKAVLASAEETSFYYVVRQVNGPHPGVIHSPYHSFGGYLWRVSFYPRAGSINNEDIAVYLACGGPDKDDPATNKRSPNAYWSVNVRFYMRLVHPSRWRELGITETDLGGAKVPEPIENPPRDMEKIAVTSYNRNESDNIVGFDEFAPLAMIQPGLFADESSNIAIKVRLVVNDRYNDNRQDENYEDPADFDGLFDKKEQEAFREALEVRSVLVQQIAEYDEKLSNVSSEAVKSVLQKEINKLAEALDSLPDLELGQ